MKNNLSALRTKRKQLEDQCRELRQRLEGATDARTRSAFRVKLYNTEKALKGINGLLSRAERKAEKERDSGNVLSIPDAIAFFHSKLRLSARWLDANQRMKGTRKYKDVMDGRREATNDLNFLERFADRGQIEYWNGPASAPKAIKNGHKRH